MSVRANGSGDNLLATQALTIGAGDFCFGVWFYRVNDTGAYAELMGLTTDASDPTGYAQLYLDSAGDTVFGVASGSSSPIGNYTISSSTWYYVVLGRTSGSLRCRVFDDSSSTTPLVTDSFSDSTTYSSFDNILIGQIFSGEYPDGEFASAKVHTGVYWSDAEARTESQTLTIQKSGGTDRLAWRLEDVDADTNGLHEVGGSGPNLTNTGFVAGASRPSQLEAAPGGATLEQEGFRWYEDNGSESAASAAANQDTNITAAAGATKRLRMLVNATGDPATKQFKLQWKKSGGSWADVL